MSTWREPLQEFDETGYNEFQRLNTNAQGEIDPSGERIIRKLFNPTTVDVTYKEFFPIILKFWYSRVGIGAPTEATLVDGTFSNPTTKDPGAFATAVYNSGDYWWVKSAANIYWSDDDGATWTLSSNALGASQIYPIKFGDTIAWMTTTRQFRTWNKTTNTSDLVGTSWDGTTVALGGGYELMSGTMITDRVFNDNGRLIVGYSAEIGDGVATLQNVVQFYYSDDNGATWLRGKAVNKNSNTVFFMYRHSATQVSMFTSDNVVIYPGLDYLGNIDFTSPTNDFTQIGGITTQLLGNWLSWDGKGELLFISWEDGFSGEPRIALCNAASNTDPLFIWDLLWDTEIGNQGMNTMINLDVYFSPEEDDTCYIYASENDGLDDINRIYRKSPIVGATGFTQVVNIPNNQNHLFRKIE